MKMPEAASRVLRLRAAWLPFFGLLPGGFASTTRDPIDDSKP